MAVHYRDPSGAAVIIPVDAALAHPLYRADAIQARVESIDLALIRAARPLDPRFAAAAIADGEPPPIGARGDRLGLWRRARGRLVVGRRAAQRDPRGPRACLDRAYLGRRSRPGGRPAPATAIPARQSGRPTDRPRSRSSPGPRRRTAAAAAASPKARCSRRSRAGSRRPSRGSKTPGRGICAWENLQPHSEAPREAGPSKDDPGAASCGLNSPRPRAVHRWYYLIGMRRTSARR